MRKQITLIISACLTILWSCDNNEIIDPYYPTVIEEISLVEQQTIVSQIDQTPFAGITSIDQFGYPFISVDIDSLLETKEWIFDVSREELAQLLKETIANYGTFLNISDSSQVEAIRYTTATDGMQYMKFFETYPDSIPPLWVVNTNKQYYSNLEVLGTSLQVMFSPEGSIGIKGHWYNDIYIPESDVFSQDSVLTALNEQTFKYSSSTLTIDEEVNWLQSKKVIFPLRYSSKIELRVCWALYHSSWELLVDTQTGEVLSAVDLDKL